jgi:diacylglycerol kinase family enzyme
MVPAYHVPQGPFGVILNANAGRVTPRLARNISRVINPDHVFLTESPEHAKEIVELCLEREYRTVFAGGGDGTIMDTINTLDGYRKDVSHLPNLGVLRLGTGNALARKLRSRRSPQRDLSAFLAGDVHRSHTLSMMTCDDTLFPFGGLGLDAAILNDYYELKTKWKNSKMSGLFSGLSGYLLAGFGKTAPTMLRQDMPEVTVINEGNPAYRINKAGERAGDVIPTGQVLYQGACSFAGGATTDLIGYGVRLFPFATNESGRFHLRLSSMNTWETATNVIPAFRGTLNHPKIHDFYVDRVRVIFNDDMPFQLGGDPKGYRKELVFGLSEHSVNFVGRA